MENSGDPIVNITGESVALGPLRKDLLGTYLRWYNDFDTQRYLGSPPSPITAEAMEAWYQERVSAGDIVPFLIYEQEDLRPIGYTALTDIDHIERTAELVITIGEPAARGRGYGTEATRLMLDYAFTVQGLHNVLLEVFEFNPVAVRAYEKAGFREIGRRRQSKMMGGRYWDAILMDCISTDFTSATVEHTPSSNPPRS